MQAHQQFSLFGCSGIRRQVNRGTNGWKMLSKSRFFFTKNQFVLKTLGQTKVSNLNIVRKQPSKLSKLLQNIRPQRYYNTQATTNATSINAEKLIKVANSVPKKSSEPIIIEPKIGYWLVGISGLVFGIVVLGGLTRLTESGLSITEWKPVTGTIPPLTEEDWEVEFSKYKDSPEFKQLNAFMTLDEFKFIFKMEWGHRQVGRLIGMVFVLPALYFWKTGKFNKYVGKRVVGLTALLGLQGAIGWWMVKSGLDEKELAERNSKPTVSQYRLTTHLGAAFLMYLGVLWTAFEILNENSWVEKLKNPKTRESMQKLLGQLNSPALKKTRYIGTGLLCLTYVTALSGGMVAGLDAGLIYNTFPHMGDDYIPSYNEFMDPVFARKDDHSDLWWRNLLENPTTVQLIHRTFATTTFFTILWAHMFVNKNKAIIPVPAKKAMHAMMGLATLQVALGISTLIYLVPIPLAATHQAGALALLTSCLLFAARLKKPRPEVMTYINKMMKDQLKAKV